MPHNGAMPYRPRFLAAILVVLSGCSLEVDLACSNFTCKDGRCPTGFECNPAGFCVVPGQDRVDASVEPEPIDAAPGVIDAEPVVEVIDAEPVEIDADDGTNLFCISEDSVLDLATGHCFLLVRQSGTFNNAKTI